VAHYTLDLPIRLKQEAELIASEQGIPLEQFILSAVAEKVGSLKPIDDPAHPLIAYRRGVSGISRPVIRGRNVRVQTIVMASRVWHMSPEQIAEDRNLSVEQVQAALQFYKAHKEEIDRHMAAELDLEAKYDQTPSAS
jgi:uncharacterized protein (DUF433 family)